MIIGFIGSVFSPFYAKARRGGAADPNAHCALNVVLYGPGRPRWALTEWPAGRIQRDTDYFALDASSFNWDGDTLTIEINERGAPLPLPICGKVTVKPRMITGAEITLDAAGRHHWRPFAPKSRVEVALSAPDLRWSGDGYFDMNSGDEPLEAGFHFWNWSRAHLKDGAALLYDVSCKDGSSARNAFKVDASGTLSAEPAPPPTQLPPAMIWRMPRQGRVPPDEPSAGVTEMRVAKRLEDTPFYSRSVLEGRLFGENVIAMHESLDLNRFASGWVQHLLPYRMRRILR